MTKKAEAKRERKRYSAEFKQQALLRAVKDGVSVAAHDLGLQPAQIYAWRGQGAAARPGRASAAADAVGARTAQA